MGDTGRRSEAENRGEGMLLPRHPPAGLLQDACITLLKVLTPLAAAAAAKSLQSCLTLCGPIDGLPPGSPVPGILQARTLEWGCHFLLQCMKVKSEREVAQLCPTPSNPMDCSLPGSSVHGIFQARVQSGVPLPSPPDSP